MFTMDQVGFISSLRQCSLCSLEELEKIIGKNILKYVTVGALGALCFACYKLAVRLITSETIDIPISVQTAVTTEIETEAFEFFWTLNNFSLFADDEMVNSPCFRGGTVSKHKWHLEMYPKKSAKYSRGKYLAIYLRLDEFGDGNTTVGRKIKVHFNISLLNADRIQSFTKGPFNLEFNKLDRHGADEFLRTDTDISDFLVDDSIEIRCSIKILGNMKHEFCNGLGIDGKRKARKDQLSSDFGKLFRESLWTDFFVMTFNTTFKAHKFVLAARSSVFAAMFNANMEETDKNSVKIIDFDDDVVYAMLEYMYTGRAEQLTNLAFELLKIADKYDIPGLKEDCEISIAENLNLENASPVLIMAHTYNADWLKSKVIEYINSNKEDVKQTQSFQDISERDGTLFLKLLY